MSLTRASLSGIATNTILVYRVALPRLLGYAGSCEIDYIMLERVDPPI